MAHRKRETCRICGGKDFRMFLSLGPSPPANSFLRSPDEFASERCFPLDVYRCETCSLVQLLDVIDPEILFRNYLYVTGTSDTMNAHNLEYARALVHELSLSAEDLVVEIASNDGSLLRCFGKYSVRTLGVEPATNLARVAVENGIKTENVFFNSLSAQKIRITHGAASAVVANNVLAHVDDPRDFLIGCKLLLKEGGSLIAEVPSLYDLITGVEYDTIYHEHLCYFSLTNLMHLCETTGFSIRKAEWKPVHGGTLRITVKDQRLYPNHSADVLNATGKKREECLIGHEWCERFAAKVQSQRNALRQLLYKLKGEGKAIAAYGAPAKGNTLLNYCGLGTDAISFVVDKNPLKVGLYTPGTHIPVLPVNALLERKPDYVLILAWNFAEEIMRQQEAYKRQGGLFIIPVPEPRIL